MQKITFHCSQCGIEMATITDDPIGQNAVDTYIAQTVCQIDGKKPVAGPVVEV